MYLAFSERIDRSLSYAVEHMTGLRVAAGIARESEFRREQVTIPVRGGAEDAVSRSRKPARLWLGGSAAWIEEERPIEARLARVHEVWWLRIWRRAPRGAALPAPEAVEDLLATVGSGAGERELEENPVSPIRKAEGNGASCRE